VTDRRTFLGLVPGSLLVAPFAAKAQPAVELTFETVWIPLTETGSSGSARELNLEGMLYPVATRTAPRLMRID
jgi:hypothetical protein